MTMLCFLWKLLADIPLTLSSHPLGERLQGRGRTRAIAPLLTHYSKKVPAHPLNIPHSVW